MDMTRSAVLGAVAAMSLLAGGCADPAASTGDGGVTVLSCGQKLTFPRVPERVVTLDQSSTETMLELGLGEALAGTANMVTKVAPEYQAAYEKVPILSEKLLSAEQLRAAAPDFVVSAFVSQYTADRVGTRTELAELGLPTFLSAEACPEENDKDMTAFDLLFSDYEAFGQIFGIEERAATLVEEQRAVLTSASSARVTGEVSVLWLYSTFNGVPYVAGGTGLPSAMSDVIGVRNAFDDVNQDWPEVSWERIAERDPDVIVVGDLSERGAPGDSAAEKITMMREHPVVSQLKAVRDNQIIEVRGIEMDPSPRSVDAVRAVVDGLRKLGHAG